MDRGEIESALSSYLASASTLAITNLTGLGQMRVSFGLPEMPIPVFGIEVSTNLTDWQLLGTAVPRFEFLDPGAPANPQRFYRLRRP